MHLRKIRGIKNRKLEGKRIVLGVTGSIAAVETVKLARELIRRGAEVIAVMSESARKIIHPYALEFATDNRVITEITGKVEHVELLGENGIADLLLIAPATANTVSKIANGIDDTPVTTMATTALGSGKHIIIAPAMHESMIKNEAVRRNIEYLKNLGVDFVEPRYDEYKAKFADIETICLHVERRLYGKEFSGRKVVVTSGPTFEQIDPIRFISNRSSGMMGYEIALELWRRGAEIKIITSKPRGLSLPDFEEIFVWSVEEMLEKSLEYVRDCDLFVSAAAAADFTIEMAESKIKTQEELVLHLKAAPKILHKVREIYDGEVIGFKAETGVGEDRLYNIAYEKMLDDRLSMVVANDVISKGMGTADTKVLVITKKRKEWYEGLKSEVAEKIVKAYIEDVL
ncbi:Phosphopantothenate-cysteine ligase /Phosphopantothenoylcysteine decarboxylase [Archaeoglobus sulfaticallidus PM70-1]|uniref:Coenzyme A biosynthesis bifunctional protein CoaBC n=1 Tax=Archaeoglobus sulfaticallidus PM70-1 TaxID=387631 RepID=N0BIR0_9EURY|nr:bifunctional phosphopantothenoylcysteine decarboxylase/phosphopantothenate--cysteine ligase CoaBC [Archaeoglobus sulfaticallidus]AGK60361.1 Phosphopantothenate-cysteine ligase /Phosphopantothenoylcysteine decarboxylase [Archaeoglobus sulfaticallidus PM70-1]